MDTFEKLAQLTKAAKLMFLNEQKEKINEMMIAFLNLRLYRKQEELAKLENFFHTIKGTAGTVQLNGLSELGEKLEEYTGSMKEETLTEEFFLKTLDGLAKVYEALQESFTDDEDIQNETEETKLKDNVEEVSYENKKKILLIDDVNLIHYLVKNLLNPNLYKVISAKTGEEGLRKSREIQPDLMIVDLMLPEMDGFEVCQRIKGDPRTKDTKIIVLSAKNKKEDIVKCIELGVDDYMVKPFSPEQLLQKINKMLFMKKNKINQ